MEDLNDEVRRNFEAGQEAFSVAEGATKVIEIRGKLTLTAYSTYTQSGRIDPRDKHPTLFHSAKEASKYFANIKVKKSRTVWLAISTRNNVYTYDSKEDADLNNHNSRVVLKEVFLEWEE